MSWGEGKSRTRKSQPEKVIHELGSLLCREGVNKGMSSCFIRLISKCRLKGLLPLVKRE